MTRTDFLFDIVRVLYYDNAYTRVQNKKGQLRKGQGKL